MCKPLHQSTVVRMACLTALAAGSTAARADLVVNGGFETGDFSGWSWSPGAGSETAVSTGLPHTGSFRLEVTTSSATYDELSQSLATLPGQQYEVSFWLSDVGLPSPTSDFQVWWEGTQVFGLGPIDVPGTGWGQFTVLVTATGPGSLLRLRMYDASRVTYADDVSVVAVPAPGAGALLVTMGLATGRRRRAAGA